jgi:hypothetical protein
MTLALAERSSWNPKVGSTEMPFARVGKILRAWIGRKPDATAQTDFLITEKDCDEDRIVT